MSCSVRFLRGADSLPAQVAAELPKPGPDFSNTEVWIPTEGAGRAIRSELERLGNPDVSRAAIRFRQPMQALLAGREEEKLASRAEREAAWVQVLADLPGEFCEILFPAIFDRQDAARTLGFAGALCDLEDLLAEGALWTGDPRVARACGGEDERWEALAEGARQVRQVLATAGLSDPNELRLQALQAAGEGPQNLIVACIPDLPLAAELLARRWLENSSMVTVLVWSPGELPAGFDAWGRPLADDWARADLSPVDEQILPFANLAAEARHAARQLSSSGERTAVVLPGGELWPELEAACARERVEIFAAGGESLATTEPGRVLLLWLDWRAGGRWKTLRTLLEMPAFASWFAQKSRGGGEVAVPAILEYLTVNCLVEDLAGAEALLGGGEAGFSAREAGLRKESEKLVALLRKLGDLEGEELLAEIWPSCGKETPAGLVLSWLKSLQNSALWKNSSAEQDRLRENLLRRTLSRERFFSPPPADAVVAHGWLEAPWISSPSLVLTGCQESVLPGIRRGHAFLPDAVRSALGLANQASRKARDAFLLEALCQSRARSDFQCSFSQRTADGSPATPSHLLLRCAGENLPGRLQFLLSAAPVSPRPRRENSWLWELPQAWRKEPPDKISPTDFSQYLRCPLRFYFSRVLGAEALDVEAAEMDARQFGTLVHDALEFFALHHPELESERAIADCVLETLEQRAKRVFGTRPNGAVQVQLEAIRVRLRAFAGLQAAERAAGWEIVTAERKLSATDAEPFILGGLPLSAKIDRIDRHSDGRLRVLDYKTTAQPKKPVETHFASAGRGSAVAEAQVEVGGREKVWADLQLPLYRMIAEKWYPEAGEIEVAYVALPADPARTEVLPLPLDENLLSSARACAEAVAAHVRRGHFWPPQPWPGNWEDPLAALLTNGREENCFTPETIAFLRGKP